MSEHDVPENEATQEVVVEATEVNTEVAEQQEAGSVVAEDSSASVAPAGSSSESEDEDGEDEDGEGDDADEASGDDETPAAPRGRGTPSKQQLEEEGDIAADYLEELLDIVDLDGDIDIDVENGRAAVSIIGDGAAARSLRQLVGPEGEVLEALQELTRLAVQAKTGDRSRLMLDVASFRAQRKSELEQLAADAVAKVKAGGGPVRFEPMSPFERKVVHDVATAAGLTSESEGEGADRRVVISA